MLADTDAIRAFGHASATQAARLAGAAATLASATTDDAALGPVAANFLAALADALAASSRTAAALSDSVAAAAATADSSAGRYDEAEQRAARRLELRV
jgi:hypothetical protein